MDRTTPQKSTPAAAECKPRTKKRKRDNQLSEQRILEAALAIAKEEGIQAVSMRALAAKLEVTQMAPYYYVPNKESLLRLVLDSVLSGVDIPPADNGPWNERLDRIITNMLDAVSEYPGLGGMMVSTRSSPNQLLVMHAVFDTFLDAGYTDEQAMLGFSLALTYITGRLYSVHALQERARRVEPLLEIPLVLGLHREDYERFAVRAIVAGIEHELGRPRRRTRRAHRGTEPHQSEADIGTNVSDSV
jgi:TetR/AcrR family tetracycline transcriptional repressor